MASAISAADPPPRSRWAGPGAARLALAASVLLSTCAPPEPEGTAPQAPSEPEIRIGLIIGAGSVKLGSEEPLTVTGSGGNPIPGAPPSTGWTVVPVAESVVIVLPSGWRSAPQEEVTVAPTSPAMSVLVNQRAYRGRIVIRRDRTGITAINRLGLESYLAGVLSAEMGRRDSLEEEALAAQAVVSRTFALRNLGKRRQEGFDLYASVVDQVYGGIGAETGQSWRAVRETGGTILTYQGAPIDAFFYSTCGGRTTEGTEVFPGAARPYLRSFRDEDDHGRAYCSLSPRFRWRVEWTVEELTTIFRQTLPAVLGTPTPSGTEVRSVRVVKRTGSDRVAEIAIRFDGGEVTVKGQAVRQVLRPPDQPALRSSEFTLNETAVDGRLVRLEAEGAGAGHGVGFCQWGAVGRSRAGQRYPEILAAYYAGTELQKLY